MKSNNNLNRGGFSSGFTLPAAANPASNTGGFHNSGGLSSGLRGVGASIINSNSNGMPSSGGGGGVGQVVIPSVKL